METFYLCIVIFLFILAVFDLVVGVSNDAVNFLNSAIGARVAAFKTIMIVAAIGVFVGATFSNGMMDIARHGIYQPQHFYFSEIMVILMSVMLTDVVLLDVFNKLGMPTSTTVSMVFELLGGTLAIGLIKTINDPSLHLGQLVNTDKALSVIMAIFLSVAIAFFFGTIVQYISRLIFSFNYTKRLNYLIGIFGGISATAIIYFMLIKGLKDSSFMTSEAKAWIQMNTHSLLFGCLIFFTILMQVLHWFKINVFKIIVLMGTFALALAFAGNDLVNFIGVPLAGYSSYIDLINTPGANPDTFLMTSLLDSASTPWYFLLGSGTIMVATLFFSKQAQNVIKTSINLSRQDEGEEGFGSTPMARALVRAGVQTSKAITRFIPESIRSKIDKNFQNDEAILADGAAFDLVRASVNLVLAGSLIALGTSLKLPLSTTYVTFMVAMGTSLADRAWGRDTAVYRITGVLSVIAGWFITAGAAFTGAFIVAILIYYGGTIVTIALIALVIYIMIFSKFEKKKRNTTQSEERMKEILATTNNDHILSLLRDQSREEMQHLIDRTQSIYTLAVGSFLKENRRGLRKAWNEIKFEKQEIKQWKHNRTLAICRLDNEIVLNKGLYFFQSNDFASELIYSLKRMTEPCLEHIENNFNPLNKNQKKACENIVAEIAIFLNKASSYIHENNYAMHEREEMLLNNKIITSLNNMKKDELRRLRSTGGSIKASMVYFTFIQESINVVNYTTNLQKVNKKFQQIEL